MNIKKLIEYLMAHKFVIQCDGDKKHININDNVITFDEKNNTFFVDGIKYNHKRIFDLSKLENYSVVMLLIKLFKKGYSKDVITLEKCWQLGHEESGYLDVFLQNPDNNDIYMFEVKTNDEIIKYTDINEERKIKQVLSYAMQEKNTKIISFYSFDFDNDKDLFYNIYTEEILKIAQNVDDFFERWNKIFDKTNYIEDNEIFNINQRVKKYEDLEEITDNDTKIMYHQFLTILRLNSISDKPNAFMKMINLFLAKIADETNQNSKFKIKDHNNIYHEKFGMKFQFVDNIDTNESFMKRLNELYKEGMKRYLNKDIIDYNDDEIFKYLDFDNNWKILEIFDNLRLKKNNNFSFIEIFDDETFEENALVVKSIVELLENFKLKYGCKHQFLGDFFENLLNTSLKQEAGQFFTPYPIVDFIINSLPYKEVIKKNIEDRYIDFTPKVIDYACGAGHFLISSIEKTQKEFDLLDETNLTDEQNRKLRIYKCDPYSWVSTKNVVGIEKDYRLAKTTKIATFLNGDGTAEIISGDGINKFSCKEYMNTCLYANDNKNEIFDFIISNPPYSVDGYMINFVKNGINEKSNTFSLLKSINYKDGSIEKMFVERAHQLLKDGGIAAIILPQSILSNIKYVDLRNYILKNFKIHGMVLTSDITFSGTTTSPVILFMEKCKCELNYETLIICSPKYINPTGKKMKHDEISFLGYEFSSDRNKTGIEIKNNSILRNMASVMHTYISENTHVNCDYDNVFYKNIDDILVNSDGVNVGDLYPKFKKHGGYNLSSLNDKCLINSRTEKDFTDIPTNYIEIGNFVNGKIEHIFKNKKTTRYCKKGDILVSSLCPKSSQIVIADADYMVSPAIHVISIKGELLRDKIYKELKNKETIEQMNTLLDGFKVTYAKISDTNLYNNVYLKLK